MLWQYPLNEMILFQLPLNNFAIDMKLNISFVVIIFFLSYERKQLR